MYIPGLGRYIAYLHNLSCCPKPPLSSLMGSMEAPTDNSSIDDSRSLVIRAPPKDPCSLAQ